MKNCKALIVTRQFPPILCGPSIVLSRLVKHWPIDSFVVFTRETNNIGEHLDYKSVPAVTLQRVSWDYSKTRKGRALEFTAVPRLVKKICETAYQHQVSAIIGVTDDGPYFISAYLAAKRLKLKLIPYMMDLYEEGRRSRTHKFFARIFQRKILSFASAIFVMSERMQQYYRSKYGLDSVVLYHPIDESDISTNVSETTSIQDRPFRIVFTGNMTKAQWESVMTLVEVVGQHPDEFTLKLYIPQDVEINLPENVEITSLPQGEIFTAQQEADVLFLPYAFDNPYPEVIRTASPGKLPEYLGSGRPILYYGPEDAYVKWYFDKTKAGICVTDPDETELLFALRRIRDDTDLRDSLSKKAIEAAQNHRASVVANIAWKTIKEVS